MKRCVSISFQIIKSWVMAAEKLIRMTKRLFSDLERMRDNLQKLLYTSAPAGPFPEPADPTMRSIFEINFKNAPHSGIRRLRERPCGRTRVQKFLQIVTHAFQVRKQSFSHSDELLCRHDSTLDDLKRYANASFHLSLCFCNWIKKITKTRSNETRARGIEKKP